MNLTFEQVKTDWFDKDALRLPAYKVGRVSFGDGRSYIRITPDVYGKYQLEEPFRLYSSLTTAINQASPTEDPLLEWYCKHGLKNARRLAKTAAHYGTLMHLLAGEYLRNQNFDFDGVKGWMMENTDDYSTLNQWALEEKDAPADAAMQSDMAAFIAFCQQHKVKPLGIEYVLLSDRGFGTLIDLVCNMEIEEKGFFGAKDSKGLPKETKRTRTVRAIINFKSGRKYIYRTHGIQALAEKMLWEENFPDLPLDYAFNWAPKDWVSSPSWQLKSWKDEISQEEIDAILVIANERFGKRAEARLMTRIEGTAYSHRPIESDCIKRMTVRDYCQQVYSDYL